MRSAHKERWLEAMAEELKALEANGVWEVAKKPRGVHVWHTKWVYKTKRDAEGLIKRLKARLVACGNKQEFGVNYSITFAVVIKMSSVKIIRVLARKWRVPAKLGDVPNAYVKADKEEELRIFIRIPKGMEISEEMLKRLGVTSEDEIVLELHKGLYGLRGAGRLGSKFLHRKLVEIGFVQSMVDLCVYFRKRGGVLVVVGVYVDDLLVTGTRQDAVDTFIEELASLSIENLWQSSQVPGNTGELRRYERVMGQLCAHYFGLHVSARVRGSVVCLNLG
ncbi:hypothetical protein PC120_g17375 [Phytophthora cactorum]|nr:hypothetical protein PC120_g17375 [Phytophthora cactorum]